MNILIFFTLHCLIENVAGFCLLQKVTENSNFVPADGYIITLPTPLKPDMDLKSNDYECSTIGSEAEVKKILLVFCCYLKPLKDDEPWNETFYRDRLKELYFT